MPPPNPVLQRRVNGWGAHIMPLIVLGLIGYSIWVIIVQICVKYLLRSHPSPINHAAAIVIIVLYSIFLAFSLVTYFRLLLEILLNPGYVSLPQSAAPLESHQRQGRRGDGENSGSLAMSSITKIDAPRIELELDRTQRFWDYDVFECEADGLPRWCSVCNAYKPDRAHHLSDAGRCVYKLDHFCPWAGGVIGDNSLKFFVQFCAYAALFTGLMLIVLAIYVAETSTASHFPDVNWIVLLALSGMFFLFAVGMTVNCLRLMLQNSTTVDSLSFSTRAYHLAIYVGKAAPLPLLDEPRTSSRSSTQRPSSRSSTLPRMVTYPLPADHPASYRADSRLAASVSPRTFAVLAVPHGVNPYRLAKPLSNLREIMGETMWDWFLPIKRSPSCTRDAITCMYSRNHAPVELTSMYPFGPALDRMISDAGLKRVVSGAQGAVASQQSKRRRKRRRKRSRSKVSEPKASA